MADAGLTRASRVASNEGALDGDAPAPPLRIDRGRFAMKGGYVYVMTNKPQGTLYVGVTGNLARRVWEHREGTYDGFTRRYGLKHWQLASAESKGRPFSPPRA